MPKGDEVLTVALRNAISANNYRAAINRKSIQAGMDLLLATKLIDKAVPISELIYEKAP